MVEKEEEVYLHFTNNEAFESIIRSKTFRLYNYESLSDKFEISLPLIILLKEIFYEFPGNITLKNNGEDKILLYIIFTFYLMNVKFIINNDFQLIIDEIIKNLKNDIKSNILYEDIKPFLKNFRIHFNDNLGLYILSFCKVKNLEFHKYHKADINTKKNIVLNDVKSNSRIYSDMILNNHWERYGNKHQGVAVKINKDFIDFTNDEKLKFNAIKYCIDLEHIEHLNWLDFYKDIFKIKDEILELSLKINLENSNNLLFNNLEELKFLFSEEKFLNFMKVYGDIFKQFINTKIPNMKMKTFEHEKEYRLSVTKNINDIENIKNFKTDPNKNTTYYELDFSNIFTVAEPLEVIVGMNNDKFLNTSYRETFQREFPFVKFLM